MRMCVHLRTLMTLSLKARACRREIKNVVCSLQAVCSHFLKHCTLLGVVERAAAATCRKRTGNETKTKWRTIISMKEETAVSVKQHSDVCYRQ